MKQLIVLILTVIALAACQKNEPAQTDTATAPAVTVDAATPTATPAEKAYTMNGKLVSRDATKNAVTIDNEEVPGGVMAPMVMAYELRGGTVESLPPDGSKVRMTLHEQDGKYWITDVKLR